jgi:hypothetical protein
MCVRWKPKKQKQERTGTRQIIDRRERCNARKCSPRAAASFNKVTAHNAGLLSQFRFAASAFWSGVCEFYR